MQISPKRKCHKDANVTKTPKPQNPKTPWECIARFELGVVCDDSIWRSQLEIDCGTSVNISNWARN